MTGRDAAIVLAHGLGDAGDLPLPFDAVVLLSGGAVLAAAVLVRARPPTPDHAAAGAQAPRAGVLATGLLRALALAGLLSALALAVAGPNDPTVSPVPRLVHGVFWPFLLLSSIALGAWWPAANPLRALAGVLARATGDPDDAAVRPLPARLGLWPAAGLLALFVWSGIAPAPRPRTVAFVLTLIVLAVLAGVVRHGRAWLACGDPFEAYAGVLARLSPLTWRAGRPMVRSPRRRLAGWQAPQGFLALVAVGIGADIFDGVTALLAWQNWRVGMGPGARLLVDTAGLAACVALAYGLGWLATRQARDLLPALVPVAAGYAAAHYLAVAPIDAQVALGQLSDPLGRGWNLLGVTTTGASYDIVPGLLAAIVVLAALVAGHVAAVVVANDCAAATRPPRSARAVQVPLRTVLVVSMLASVFVRFGGG